MWCREACANSSTTCTAETSLLLLLIVVNLNSKHNVEIEVKENRSLGWFGHGRRVNYCLGVLGRLARLSVELLNDRFILVLGLEAHASLLALRPIQFNLVLEEAVLRVQG